MKVSRRWQRMVPLYRYFARDFVGLDWSDEALLDAFRFESTGGRKPSPMNGYAVGKAWLNVQVSAWRADLGKLISRRELYEDENLPHWWLDSVLPPPGKYDDISVAAYVLGLKLPQEPQIT